MASDTELIARVPLFANLDETEREALVATLEPVGLAEGAFLFHRGDPGGILYIVVAGRVVLSVTDDEGNIADLVEHEAGDFLGELSLLDGGPRSSDAWAAEDARLVALDRGGLLEFVSRHPHAALDLFTVVGGRIRAAEARSKLVRSAYDETEDDLTFGERVSDKVAEFGGSWRFIFAFGGILLGWITLNLIMAATAFDPYPFILLNLVLSALAALQAPVIMMSQNRQAAKDRKRSALDYQIDRRAELEVVHLHRKVDDLHSDLRALLARVEPGKKHGFEINDDSCHGG